MIMRIPALQKVLLPRGMAPSALDRLGLFKSGRFILKVKDAEGHEHASDGKFTSGSGGSGKGKSGKTKRKLERRSEAAHQANLGGKAIQTLLSGRSALDNIGWLNTSKPKEQEKKPEAKPEPKPTPKPETKKPEPKPEPKPEAKPVPKKPKANGSEVQVNTSGAWTGYKAEGKVNISVAVVQGGGRTLMGSNIMRTATSDDVAVVMYRAARDGPLTFPEAMFGNEKFRQAMHDLEDLGKVTFVDSGNGREKIMYELGPDGKPKHAPSSTTPPSSIPASAKRPSGPINANVKELPEHVPAKTPAEALSRMAKYVPEGAKVEYADLPTPRLNSLLKGAEHVLGKYGVTVEKMGFVERHGDEYGLCQSHNGRILSVGVRKMFAANPEKYKQRDIARMTANRKHNIERTEKFIEHLKTSTSISGDVESEIRKQEKKLTHIKNVEHWIVADAVDDPLYAVQAHECMHAVYHYHGLGETFKKEMEKVGGWSIPLTEYATENQKEFFAELGSAITCGMKVHPKLMEAFQNTVRTIR